MRVQSNTRHLRLLIAVLSMLLETAACAAKPRMLTRSRLLMGHVPVNISLRSHRLVRSHAIAASDEAYRLAETIEGYLSEYQSHSDIACLNRRAGLGPCRIHASTLALLQQAVALSKATDHAFDLRFASLSAQGRKGGIVLKENPPQAALLHPETRIGIGAIGKGFIVDRMIELLQKKGFEDVLIDAGGDLRAIGGVWQVAIQRPGQGPNLLSHTFNIRNRALATSGSYEQGRHIVDPLTGKSLSRTSSATIEAETLTVADALATACFVMGEEASQILRKKFPSIRIFWTRPDGTVTPSAPAPSEL